MILLGTDLGLFSFINQGEHAPDFEISKYRNECLRFTVLHGQDTCGDPLVVTKPISTSPAGNEGIPKEAKE